MTKTKFTKGQIVWAKEDFLEHGENQIDTIGIVLDYNETNNYLKLGTLHPEKYALPPVFDTKGEYYEICNLYPQNTKKDS